MTDKKYISESVEESKDIPEGRGFTKLRDIYKVISSRYIDSFADRYHRKKSDGYVRGGNACYGIAGYTHMDLKGAMCIVDSYGGNIVKMKLLGGFERYVFFDAESDPDIKRELIATYGKPLSVRDQLYVLTGSWDIANRYGGCYSSQFGNSIAEQIMRESGKIIRGFICIYTSGYVRMNGTQERVNDVMVNPLVFSDMVPCAIARNVSSYDTVEAVEAKFQGTLDQKRRDLQNGYIDLVPHLYAANAKDPDGGQGTRINDKYYCSYTDVNGRHNLLIVDEKNWGNPKDYKLFPDTVKIDEVIGNPGRKGFITFSMRGQKFIANVCGIEKVYDENSATNSDPVFALVYKNEYGQLVESQWYPLNAESITWVYQNYPESIESLKGEGEGEEEQGEEAQGYENGEEFGQEQEVGDGNENEYDKVIEEDFTPGMSYNDFVAANSGKDDGTGVGQPIMYVCTHCYNVEGIMQKGFSRAYANANDFAANGGALTYGDGVYGSPSLDNAANHLSKKPDSKPDGKKYGDVILKCILMGGWKGFLIFDETWAKKIYGPKWHIFDQIDTIIKNDAARNEIKGFIQNECYGENFYDPGDRYNQKRTSSVLFKMFDNHMQPAQRQVRFEKWTNFFRRNGIRGGIYWGYGDRFACVCYDYSEVVPIQISYDHGQTWTTRGFTRTLPNGKTYSSKGIDWAKTSERLTAGGDPRAKLGARYDDVDLSNQRVRIGNNVVGFVQVGKNGKYNFVSMQDVVGIDGQVICKKYNKYFPIDFDDKASIGTLRGTITFVYRGITFQGKVFDPEANGPTIVLTRRSKYPPFRVEERIEMQYTDWIVDNYDAYMNGDFEEGEDDGEYQEQNDAIDNSQIQEQFFKTLDRIEGVLHD